MCEERDRDRYGRIVAVCYASGEDLNAWMVAQGLALVYRRYSMDYVDHEADALIEEDEFGEEGVDLDAVPEEV